MKLLHISSVCKKWKEYNMKLNNKINGMNGTTTESISIMMCEKCVSIKCIKQNN